ncbi:putative integral membrane protein [Babesia bovis T2Bo]|uniref:putative integral membrane protein n=1 Tax=Babesia bovis T2Bo TaxID=484906 RepID=UPI001D9789F7|nr:putative integral membrane protein [Babesia bovis T2Bo]KAG6439985.1 putative integral membrane protein [Babesia bovis T2Bo]
MDCIIGLIGVFYFFGVSANSSHSKATVDTSSKGVGGKFFGNKKLMITVGVILALVIVICVSIYYCSNGGGGGGGGKSGGYAGIVIGILAIGGILCWFFWKKIRCSFSNKFGSLFAKKAVENVVTS